MLYKCRPLSWADGWRDRVSSGNQRSPLSQHPLVSERLWRKRVNFCSSSYLRPIIDACSNCIQEHEVQATGYCLQLAGNHSRSEFWCEGEYWGHCLSRQVFEMADAALIASLTVLVREDYLYALSRAPDIPRDGVITHNTF